MTIKDRIKKWLGLDILQSQADNFAEAHRKILHTNRELLDKVVNFQSQMCKEYIELKDRIEALERSWQMSQTKLQEQVKEMSETIARLTESNNNLVQNQQLAMVAIQELVQRVKKLESKEQTETNAKKKDTYDYNDLYNDMYDALNIP